MSAMKKFSDSSGRMPLEVPVFFDGRFNLRSCRTVLKLSQGACQRPKH
jgi:hypothetical protein